MKVFKLSFSLFVIAVSIIILFMYGNYLIPDTDNKKEKLNQSEPSQINLDNALDYINEPVTKVKNHFGEPIREDKSAYGYTWLIYNDSKEGYIQFGIRNKEIVTVFTVGNVEKSQDIVTSTSYQQLNNELEFKDKIAFKQNNSTYEFELTKQDLQLRPLVKLEDDTYLQLYFDTITNDLIALRILTADILLKQQPYKVVYQGILDNQIQLKDDEWEKVEEGAEKQVFDITNEIRSMYLKKQLKWSKSIHEIAYSHSKDMERNNYFSHQDLNGNGLKERLGSSDVSYLSAGENIAAEYTDAPAAVVGWLNSKGHREALLNESFTHLGVGVYRMDYTQNFIEKP